MGVKRDPKSINQRRCQGDEPNDRGIKLGHGLNHLGLRILESTFTFVSSFADYNVMKPKTERP